MKNITTRTEGQGSFELLTDPVYGPNSKYFWPGRYSDARSYIFTSLRISPYVSGEEFLEIYAESASGVEAYIESTDYLEESYCDTLYDHFYNLYKDVESWDRSTLFVSAVYRGLFHEMFPYQSELLELRTNLSYKSIYEPYLKEGRYDEAIRAAYGKTFKEADKKKRGLSSATCDDLMKYILCSDIDLSSELVAVLHRTNIAVSHQKQLRTGLVIMLRPTNALSVVCRILGKGTRKYRKELEDRYGVNPYLNIALLGDLIGEETMKDLYGKNLLLSLSLLQIEPEAAQKAVDDCLSLPSHEPILRLIGAFPFRAL